MSAYKFESWTICKTEHQIFLYQGIEPIDSHEKIDVCRVSELEKIQDQLKQKDAEIVGLKLDMDQVEMALTTERNDLKKRGDLLRKALKLLIFLTPIDKYKYVLDFSRKIDEL